ncbi:hypothetical protein [Winogradskyella sp.]|uniref:hypothetical protein n=1 Tax=Winogradskyella sp. TaxID=1883156 RepID=UPI001B04BE93|nr:hypothetical protein [Winogradskyella sp.]MBO6880713.1 hypothetical protein [Winogradskyella sp.]
MKKILTLTFFMCSMFYAMAQTDGITYQAVIIGPDDLELPGVDSEGNYLPNTTIAVRFTIYDSTNQIEFQEVQITETDDFGRINLLIGEAEHDYFKEMNWDGTPKDLKVEIDFEAGSNFEEMSRERLTFLPYAYHRNITATGTLTVDDKTFLNGELEVEGPTNLFSSLTVHNNNPTLLTGDLSVDGIANLNNALNVINGSPTNLSGDLSVDGNSNLDGTLDVIGLTTLNELTVNGQASFGDLSASTLTVSENTTLIGGINMEALNNTSIYMKGDGATDSGLGKYRHTAIIDAKDFGLAIEVDGSRSNNTNFITFYDETRALPWGRIEGERDTEFTNNADYNYDKRTQTYDIFDAYFDVSVSVYEFAKSLGEIGIASTSSTPCVGFGACVTAPIPSWIIGSTAQSIVAGLQIVASGVGVVIAETNESTYEDTRVELQGVTYASGAGDYAEYLLRENVNEKMTYGDIVGVRGGKISKDLSNAERMMVVSYKPIVLGNMPEVNRETEYEKVAFMGQVPVKVFGSVNIGDYIIPSGKNDGVGRAINPEKITVNQLRTIVGIAWTSSDNPLSVKLINTAVGVNRNDSSFIIEKLEDKVDHQTQEINYLKSQIETILVKINNIENGTYQGGMVSSNDDEKEHHSKYEIVESPENDVIYYEITRDDFEKGLLLAEKMILSANEDQANDKLVEALKKLKTDPGFKNRFFTELQVGLRKQIHFHQEIDKTGRH